MNNSDFSNKTYIVTGGGSGIGHAVSEQLLEHGANVVIGQRQQANIGYWIATDLSKAEGCQQLVEKTIGQYQRIDGIVNNAGMMFEQSVVNTTIEQWNYNLAVNLTAPFLLIKYALPYLIKQGGSIVNIGSVEGIASNPLHSAYCASKGGIHALTRAVAIDHGSDNIRCNAVAPGWIDTDLNLQFIQSTPDPEAFKNNLATIHPVGRTGKPEDVANLVCWLLSEQSSFVTGQIWTIDGGRMAKLSLPN